MFRAVGLSRAQATHSPRSLGDRERVVDAGQPERTEVVVYASEAGPSDSRCPGWVRLRARGSQPPLPLRPRRMLRSTRPRRTGAFRSASGVAGSRATVSHGCSDEGRIHPHGQPPINATRRATETRHSPRPIRRYRAPGGQSRSAQMDRSRAGAPITNERYPGWLLAFAETRGVACQCVGSCFIPCPAPSQRCTANRSPGCSISSRRSE